MWLLLLLHKEKVEGMSFQLVVQFSSPDSNLSSNNFTESDMISKEIFMDSFTPKNNFDGGKRLSTLFSLN
jgi:hypothetical protein